MRIKKGTLILRFLDIKHEEDLFPLSCLWLVTSVEGSFPTAVDIQGTEITKGLVGNLFVLAQTKNIKTVEEALQEYSNEVVKNLLCLYVDSEKAGQELIIKTKEIIEEASQKLTSIL